MKFLAAYFLLACTIVTAQAQATGLYTRMAGQSQYFVPYWNSYTVMELKQTIGAITHLDASGMDLFYNGQYLLPVYVNPPTLADLGIVPFTYLDIYPALLPYGVGGGTLWNSGATQNVNFADYGNGTLNVTKYLVFGDLDLTDVSTLDPVILSLTTTAFGNAVALQNFNPAANATWTLASATDGIRGFEAGKFLIDTSSFLNAPSEGTFSVVQSENGNDLNLIYTIPEPGTWTLFAVAASFIAFRFWRRPLAR